MSLLLPSKTKAALALALMLAGCGSLPQNVGIFSFGLHPDSATGGGAVIVARGDTLWNIAQRYRLPVRDIIEVNALAPPYAMATGQRLKLPPPADYTVGYGDTVAGIARMFNVSASQIVRVNEIPSPYTLRVGQVLRLPSKYAVQEGPPVVASRVDTVVAEPLEPVAGKQPSITTTTQLPARRVGFGWPVKGKIVSGFGAKEGGLYNDGVNISAPLGAPVLAASDGTVIYAGSGLKTYGNLVLIRHTNGVVTAYAHLDRASVLRGTAVRRGETIGTVGKTGGVSTPQLHFEIRKGRDTVDPMAWLG